MTQPPPPSDPTPGSDPAGPPPALPPGYDPAQAYGAYGAQQQPEQAGVPQYFGPPTGYDPAQSLPVYQAAPTGGYGVPIFGQQAGYDPLISPDYSGWWRRTTAVLKPGWRILAGLQFIGFLVSLLVSVPQALYLFYLSDQLPKAAQDGTITSAELDLKPFFVVFGITFVGIFLTYLVAFAVTIASNHVVVSIAAGLRPRIGTSLAMAAKRVFPLLGWQLLAGLIVLVGLCACVLPAIYLVAVFLILPAVVTFERGSAIGRCFALFHRDLGASVSRVATIFGISIGIGIVGAIIGQVIELALGSPQTVITDFGVDARPTFTSTLIVAVLANAVVTGLLSAGGAVLTAPLTLTAYADMRARVDPLSTAVLASEIGLTPAATPEWGAPAA
jgi:hypothetical protein